MVSNQERGFTLVELSIVLVIIGLIVGGVLVGRDLIHAATIRAQISQLETFDTAVNAFQGKYGGIPGDLPPGIAGQYGFFPRTGGPGDGDGDGDVYPLGGPANLINAHYLLGGENVLFWTDLSSANLIPGSFNDSSDALVNASTPGQCAAEMLVAKIGSNNYIYVNSVSVAATLASKVYQHHYQIVNLTSISSGLIFINSSLSPSDSFAIDQKLDDGYPTTGAVQAMVSANAAAGLSVVQSYYHCVQNGSVPTYMTTSSYANSITCSIMVNAQW